MASDELAAALRDAITPALNELSAHLIREFSRLNAPNDVVAKRLLLRPLEAAEALGISERSLSDLATAGAIPRIVLGPRLIRYSVDDLREAIREHRIQPDPTKED